MEELCLLHMRNVHVWDNSPFSSRINLPGIVGADVVATFPRARKSINNFSGKSRAVHRVHVLLHMGQGGAAENNPIALATVKLPVVHQPPE
mmetsp:Transcript_31466/g.88272  ORF Transcript_31466/g.88272 Transcript_31466/m.88272 type:complete len:91 (+) Transcript_31466:2-274(+)